MKIKFSVLLVFCLTFIFCATAPTPRQIQNSFPIEKPFDSTWQAVIEVFAELSLPIMNMEKASGLITTDWISFRGQKNTDYADCGKGGLMDVEKDRLGKFNVYVKKISESSCEIKINSLFEKHYVIYDNPSINKSSCVSSGKLEAQIFKSIQEKIK
jgi:hypothetical protein